MTIAKKADFIIENKQPVYPNITTDGLVLYYDAKGKENSHTNRENLVDMSGNGNHGELHNFAYENFSGYKDGLIFDGIDDKLVRPNLGIPEDNFTFQLNGNIISFSPDGTVKRVQDREVVERKGINLIRNGNFLNGTTGWHSYGSTIAVEDNKRLKVTNNGSASYAQVFRYIDLAPRSKYYFRTKFEFGNIDTHPFLTDWFSGGVRSSEGLYELVKENTSEEILRVQLKFSKNTTLENYYYINNIQLINLTATFGAGNEPTLEEIQAEPDKWQWLPNPLDLIEAEELKGNILGDMEGIIDDMDRDKVSGTEVFTDKADDSVVHVEVDGKSYQHAGSGKNLLRKTYQTVSGGNAASSFGAANYSEIENGYRITGRWTSFGWKIMLKPSVKYTISGKLTMSNTENKNEQLQVRVNRHSGSDVDGVLSTVATTNKRFSFTFTSRHDDVEDVIAFGTQATEDVLTQFDITEIQLEEGSVATEYEPPAPTPDYPIEIHSLNDFDVVSSVGKRNLMRNSDFKDGMSNWGGDNGEVVNRDGYIYYEFTGDGEANIYGTGANYKVLLEPNTEYVYSVDIWAEEEIKINRSTPLHYHIKSISTGKGVSEGVSLVSDSEVEANKWSRVILQFRTNSTTDGYLQPYIFGFPNGVLGRVKNFKLEKSSTVTPYIPSFEDVAEETNHPLIDKVNLSLSEPLRSVGSVKDRLFKDSDGLWKIERNVGEYTFKGSENWEVEHRFSNDSMTQMYSSAQTVPNQDTRTNVVQGVSNRFLDIGADATKDNNGRKGIWVHNGYRVVRFKFDPKKIGQTMDSTNSQIITSMNNWLKDNQTTILYKLAIPTIETLDQELQNKLNNLRSFQDSNYVYTVLNKTDILSDYVVDNLKPTLHTSFLPADWYKEDKVINNLMIYNRALSDEEMLQNYRSTKHRWSM